MVNYVAYCLNTATFKVDILGIYSGEDEACNVIQRTCLSTHTSSENIVTNYTINMVSKNEIMVCRLYRGFFRDYSTIEYIYRVQTSEGLLHQTTYESYRPTDSKYGGFSTGGVTVSKPVEHVKSFYVDELKKAFSKITVGDKVLRVKDVVPAKLKMSTVEEVTSNSSPSNSAPSGVPSNSDDASNNSDDASMKRLVTESVSEPKPIV